MRSAWLLCVTLPTVAAAAPAPVVGGADAKAGKWPDAAAILYPTLDGDQALCSGTLVAPTVVLTAGHCFVEEDGLPDNVLVGTNSLDKADDGEILEIDRGIVFPDSDFTEDIAVLVLAKPSKQKPRAIATGWARTDIVNGADVALVGYGAVDRQANMFIDELQEAKSKITDANCTRQAGCNEDARPDGELGAGGNGVDTCPGDSGGPLYLTTKHGTYLAGVTSRSYDDARFPCSEGGIYVRPDKLVDWIERVAGTRVQHGPEPEADAIEVIAGGGGNTKIHINDPDSSNHSLEVTVPPAHGQANVRDDGALRICADPAALPGDDAVTVTITDAKTPTRQLSITVPITIGEGAVEGSCDLDDFPEGGGCCDAGTGSAGALPLAAFVLAAVRRRRR